MSTMKDIRNDFKKKFYQLAEQENIEVTNEWDLPIPEWNCILLKWKSEHLKKIISVQEEDEEDSDSLFKFSYVVDITMVYSEEQGYEQYNSITILTKNSHQQVETIFDIYKLWFIDKKTPKEMEHLLEEYFTKLNGHSRDYYERLFEKTSEPVEKDALITAIEAQMSDNDDEEQRGGT